MSNLKYAIVENETYTTSAEETAVEQQARPYLVLKGGERSGDTITRRVEAALDFELAQGRMPA